MSENGCEPDDWPAEKSATRLLEYLQNQPGAHNVRRHKYTVDFTIGDPDLWPSGLDDEELNVIRGSSVSFGGLTPDQDGEAVKGNPQTGSNIHLPPARSGLFDELESDASFPDTFTLVNGTFQLGSLLPPPDGVCTPHLIIVENAPIGDVIDAIDEAFRLYQEFYDGGEEIVKVQPPIDGGDA